MEGGDDQPAPVEPLVRAEPWGARERCRSPDPAGPAWELTFAAAETRSRTAARRRLGAVADVVEQALSATAPTRPWVVTGTALGLPVHRFTDLFDDEVVHHDLPPARIAVRPPKPGHPLPDIALAPRGFGLHRPEAWGIAALVRDGGGLAILGVDEQDPVVNAWCEDIDRLARQSCRLDLVVAGPDGVGHGEEAVDAVRLLVGAAGAGLVGSIPPAAGSALPTAHPVGEGDVVVLPVGWGWQLTGAGRSVLAAVLTIPRPTLAAVAVAAASEAVLWPTLRGDVPDRPGEPTASYGGSPYDHPDGLRRAVDELATAETIAVLGARARAGVGARWRASLRASLAIVTSDGADLGAALIRVPFPGGLQCGPAVEDGDVTFLGGGRRFRSAPDVAEAVGSVADGEPHPVARLGSSLDDPTQAGRLAIDMVRAGLAETVG